MGQMCFENDQILYEDGERKEILYGCEGRIYNFSRIPLRVIGEEGDSLLSLVLEGVTEHDVIAEGTKEKDASCEYATMNLLLAQEHMKTPYELKVLEIGCSSGILSYHLAKILGKYNENSQLCCVTNVIGSESEKGWMDRISCIKCMPRVSFLVSDYDDMPLSDGYFDVVILNASEEYEKKEAVLFEARRVLKRDGLFLAYVVGDVGLIQQIAYQSNVLKTYIYLPDRCLLRVPASEFMPLANRRNEPVYNIKNVVDRCDKMLESDVATEELRDMLRYLDACVDEAIVKRDLENKILFIKYKGELLDKLVRIEYGR